MTIVFWFENSALSGDDYNKQVLAFIKSLSYTTKFLWKLKNGYNNIEQFMKNKML